MCLCRLCVCAPVCVQNGSSEIFAHHVNVLINSNMFVVVLTVELEMSVVRKRLHQACVEEMKLDWC